MLTLFLTIALCSTSQVKYIINSDTIIGYSLIENRNIATIFLEGERDKALLYNCDSTVNVLLEKNVLLNSKIEVQDKTINTLKEHYDNVTVLAKEADKANKKNKLQLLIGKILITLLTIGLIIK